MTFAHAEKAGFFNEADLRVSSETNLLRRKKMFLPDLLQNNHFQWGRKHSVPSNERSSKNSLFVLGMEEELEQFLFAGDNPVQGKMFVLKCFGPIILHPFGDVMRSIILAVYGEQVTDIFVIGTEKEQHPAVPDSLLYCLNDEAMAKKRQTLDYMFQYCRPEFPFGDLMQWLSGCPSAMESVRQSVRAIRMHPLIPVSVQVQGFLLKNGQMDPIDC